MDPRRFDALTQSLAAARTRRGLLGALAAVGAGLLRARAAEAQVTQAQCGNVLCAANPGICKPGCVCCVYPNGNSRCRPPQDCTASGTVVSPTTTTTTTAAPTTTTTTTTTSTTVAPTPACAGASICTSYLGACGSQSCMCATHINGTGFCAVGTATCSPSPCASNADCAAQFPGGTLTNCIEAPGCCGSRTACAAPC